MGRKIRKFTICFLAVICLQTCLPVDLLSGFSTVTVYAKNGFNKKPGSDVGFKEHPKTKGKVKAPGSNDYGYKDEKGRVWVPDGKMHGGRGWTRVYPDGSHDHVYENGNVRVHESASNKASANWLLVAVGIILLGVTIFSPVPGDEVIIGGALLGI